MMPLSEEQGYGHAEVARTYQIRPATMADSPAIRRIRNAAVQESLAIWTSIEQDHAETEAWLAPMVQRGTALVAHVSGRPQDVVGFAVAGPWHSYEGYARTVEESIYLFTLRRRAKVLVPGSSPPSSRPHGEPGTAR